MQTNQEREKLTISKIHLYNHFVAVEGCVGDWACYVGQRNDSIQKVAAYGDKISETEARELFPEFKHLRWRP
jgi:hypothetical protein